MMAPLATRLRLFPILTAWTLLGVALLAFLGTWQLHRLEWKKALIAVTDANLAALPAALGAVMDMELTRQEEFLPVRLRGLFLPGRKAFGFGQVEDGAGWFVFQPFQVVTGPDENTYGGVVLINRGFVPIDTPLSQDAFPAPEGLQEEIGLLRRYRELRGPAAWLRAAPDGDAGRFYARERAPLVSYFFGDTPDTEQVASFYIDSGLNDAVDSLPRGGTTKVSFSNRHLGYALTWYALAIGLVGVYGVATRGRAAR